jgi:hypothetical protein
MTMPVPSDGSDPPLVTIEVGVEREQTKTVHRVKKDGQIRFKKSKGLVLTIESPAPDPPFLVPGFAAPQSRFTVTGSELIVGVSNKYDVGSAFTYAAQIDDSAPEDPIVIIERR